MKDMPSFRDVETINQLRAHYAECCNNMYVATICGNDPMGMLVFFKFFAVSLSILVDGVGAF
jgi:hypothetical protein